MSDTKSKTISWPLIFLIILVVMLMTAGTSYLMVYLFGGTPANTTHVNEMKASKENAQMGPTQSMGEFVVNLTSTRSYRYIKTEVYVEMENDELKKEIEDRSPQLRDAINAILRSQTEEDIKEADLGVLKQKILEKINEYLIDGKVKNVYFDEFVIQ